MSSTLERLKQKFRKESPRSLQDLLGLLQSPSEQQQAALDLIQLLQQTHYTENQLGSCWFLISQLPFEHRSLVLEFMSASIACHDAQIGPILRKEFYHHLSSPHHWDWQLDLNQQIQVLTQLTKEGRDLKGFESDVGACLFSWLSFIYTNQKLSEPQKYALYTLILPLITNIFKFSFLHLPESQVNDLLQLISRNLDDSRPDVQESCLIIYDTVIRYGSVPLASLSSILEQLCFLQSTLKPLVESIARNLFASHRARAGIKQLVSFLASENEMLVRGSLHFLVILHWGENPVQVLETSDFYLLSHFPFLLTGDRIELEMDVIKGISAFVIARPGSISLLEWDLALDVVSLFAQHLTLVPELVLNLSSSPPSKEDDALMHLKHLLFHIKSAYDSLLPETRVKYLQTLKVLSYNLDKEAFAFLIEHTQRSELLDLVPCALTSSQGRFLVEGLCDKLESLAISLDSKQQTLTSHLVTLEDEVLFSRILSLCLHSPSRSLLDTLSTVMQTHKNEITLMHAAKGLVKLWDLFAKDVDIRSSNLDVDTFKRILFYFTEETLPMPVRIYIARFLCGLGVGKRHIRYIDLDSNQVRTCPTLVADQDAPETGSVTSLPTDEYLSRLLVFMVREPHWQVYSTVLESLPAQLQNLTFYQSTASKGFIVAMGTAIINLFMMETVGAQLVDIPINSKSSDLYPQLFKLLCILLQSYKPLFSKKHLDDAVLCFLLGLARPTISRNCMHSMTLALYEYPYSITKHLSAIIMKLSQMTSLALGIQNLEFLSHLGRLSPLHVNLTEADYKRVFGIALQYIRGGSTMNQQNMYIVHLAYHVLSLWFVTLPLAERRAYVPFISKQLMMSGMDENVELVLDMLALYAFADCEPRSSHSAVTSGKTWLLGNTLVTIQTVSDQYEWNEIIIRRPSGTVVFWNRLENTMPLSTQLALSAPVAYLLREDKPDLKPTDKSRHVRSISTGSVKIPDSVEMNQKMFAGVKASAPMDAPRRARSISVSTNNSASTSPPTSNFFRPSPPSRAISLAELYPLPVIKDKLMDPSFFLAQVSGIPNPFSSDTLSLPVLLPSDDSFMRSLSVLDRTPVIDLHKIGVLYLDQGQSTESDMLGNVRGSEAYGEFLESLGSWFQLDKSRNIYSGGLDTSGEMIDGVYALAHVERLSQCVFHVTTLMPYRETDPLSTFKKRHIGNDYVNIIWNESKRLYSLETIQGQFNFVAIVIEPLDSGYQVTVQVKPDMPHFALFSEPRLVSKSCLGPVIRVLAVHMNTFSQIWAQRFVTSSKERLLQIQRIRERCGVARDEDKLKILDFTRYT